MIENDWWLADCRKIERVVKHENEGINKWIFLSWTNRLSPVPCLLHSSTFRGMESISWFPVRLFLFYILNHDTMSNTLEDEVELGFEREMKRECCNSEMMNIPLSGHWVLIYVAASSDPQFLEQLFGMRYHLLDPVSRRCRGDTREICDWIFNWNSMNLRKTKNHELVSLK